MKIRHYALLGCSSLALTCASFAALAQQAEEIIVTAQRRAEALETVPMSVTVVNPEVLARTGINNFEQINQLATGTQFNFSGAFIQPAIRGVTTTLSGNNVENNVAIYVDGLYEPNPLDLEGDLANLQSIQVLKGPQGTLYGRNATGGAILINTLGPTKQLTGSAEIGYGRFDEISANGYLAGPLSDTIRFSLTAHHRYTPGYYRLIDPVVVGQYDGRAGQIKQDKVRAKLEVDVTSDLTATLTYSYGYNRDDRTQYFTPQGHMPVTTILALAPNQRAYNFGDVGVNGATAEFGIKNEGILKVAWNTPIGTLTSYTGYAAQKNKTELDADGTYSTIGTESLIHFRQKTVQEAVDYNITAINKLDLVVGGMYYNDKITAPAGLGVDVYSGTGAFVLENTINQPTEAWALYVDGTYHLTDRLSLGAGVRYSHDHKELDYSSKNAAGLFTIGPAHYASTWTRGTPRVTARYELANRTDVYASWSRGYRSGQYNGSGPPFGNVANIPVAQPEDVDAYELGFKTAQSRYSFNTAVFFDNYTNLMVNQPIQQPACVVTLTTGCNFSNAFVNAPGSKIYGIDAELTVKPVENLSAHLGLEWLHGRFTNFTNFVGTGVDAANALNVANQSQNMNGQQLARAPNFSGNFGIDYTVPTSHNGTFLFSANVYFTTSYVINNISLYDSYVGVVDQVPTVLQGKQRFRQDGYGLLSAQVTWTDPTEHYYITFYGKNLSDHDYRIAYNTSTTNGDYGPKGDPLLFGGKVGVKF